MASPENILLHLGDGDEAAVRSMFGRLHEQGFPKQHQTPHVTITFSPNMRPEVVQRAAEILPRVVPATFQRVGTVIFGTGRKQTVAWLLETSDELEAIARELSALNPDGRGDRWIPHLTVGLRLPRNIIPDYLRALEEITPRSLSEMTATQAVFWRPRVREQNILATGSSE